jgi:PAS domain S-box-containing protein
VQPWTGLQAIGERLATVDDVASVWDATLRAVVEALDADSGAWIWQSPDPAVEALDASIPWQELLDRADEPTAAQCGALRSSDCDTLVLPITVEAWAGWLLVVREDPPFAPADLEHASAGLEMARVAAAGALRVERVQRTQARQLQELETLQRMGRLIDESLDLETTLRVVLESLVTLVPYDVGEITLLDPERDVLVSQAYHVSSEEPAASRVVGMTYQLDEGYTGWLARHRQPLLIQDVAAFEQAYPKNQTLKHWARSFLGIPLLIRGELIGTLEVAAAPAGKFTQHDQELAALFGSQAAIAIENARLYEASQRRLETLEALRESVRAVGRAGDPEAFFQEMATRVADLANAEVAGILLYDADREVLFARAPFIGVPDAWVDNYVIPLSKDGAAQRRWRERYYWIIEDAQSDPRVEALGLHALASAVDAHQVLVVPVETHGNLVGFIQVANPKDRERFTESDANMLAMLASQVSGMVRISQLVERMARHTEHLRSLVSVASIIGASLDLDTVLDEVVRTTAEVLGCQRTVIFVLDPMSGHLDLVAGRGISDRYRELSQDIPVEEGGRAHAIAADEMVIAADVAQEPESAPIAPFADEEGFRAFADLPLRRGERPVGLLSVQYAEPHHFSDDEISLLRILSEQAAIAIENARLYTQTDVELRRRLESMEALQRVTREITATVDLDYILRGVLEEAIRFSEADAGFIALFDDTDVEVRAVLGYDEEALVHLQRVLTDLRPGSPLKAFLERQEAAYIADVAARDNAQDYPPGARSLMIEPVFYEERLAAAILIQRETPSAFTPAMQEFVEGLAVQTSIAVGNARRYQEQLERGELMHKRAEQMSLLLEVTRTMRSDRPLEDILLDVAYAVQEGTGFNIVLISVLEGESLRRVAGAGIPLAELERMKQVRHSWSRIKKLFQERFQLGRCYYIPAEYYEGLFNGIDVFIPESEDVGRQPGMWHQMDTFIIPLHGSRGDIVGLMSVDQPLNGRAPTPMKAEIIEIFAAQVALAIENSRLVENLRRQVNTLSLFNELNRSITTKLDLPLVLNTVVQAVTNLLDYDYATIYLQDKSGQMFMPMASSGYSLDLLDKTMFELGEGLVGSVAQMGMPLVLEDVQSDARFEPGPVPIGASMMVPLTVEGRSVGVLAADSKEARDFSPTAVATLTALADQVSVAVDNARLFDEVKRFSEELEARVDERTQELAETMERLRLQRDRSEVLYHIASELVASLDMDRVLSQALSMLQKAVQASKSAVILLDNNTGELYYRAAIGHTEPIPPGGRLAPFNRDEGLVGWVLVNKEALIIPDAQEDPRCATIVAPTARSVLTVPVLGGGDESLGVILLQSPVVDAFAAPELRLVEAAAVQLGNALNNAELYRLIREQAERLGTMLRAQRIEAAKNQSILEGIADGVMVGDANGRVILFNAAAERILSITREQALGRFLDDILGLYGSSAREWMAQIEVWQQSPEAYGADEFLATRIEAGRQVVSVHLSPVVSSGQEFLGVVSVFRDITAEVEADRAKSEFVSTVSHELRTPMTSIVGYIDLMLMGATGDLSDLQLDFLKKVKGNSERLTGLVNDLLDISRIETGRIELQCMPVAMEDVVAEVMDLLQPKVVEKEQSIRMQVPEALPQVYGDPDRLTQILTNIAGNAHKYTPAGGEIEIHVYVRDAMVHVAVADNGIGIAPANQKKIFERFYRVEDDPAVYEVSGTGLGLAISLSLIQMHGGTIDLESELGVGSIFTFSVPLAEGEPQADVGAPPPTIVGTPKATILVVEDDDESADLLQLMLRQENVAFLTASSGEDALHIAREKLPDLISLDIRLPDLDGFEVLQLLKRDPQTADIPVIIISVVPDRERGLDYGAVAYLTKPIDEDRLRKVVMRLLNQRGTVIVADGNRENLDAMRAALQLNGVRVRTTRRGEQAVLLAKDLRPALMVLDQTLPDMDGYQVLETLRHHPNTANIPVIVMTEDAVDAEGTAAGWDTLGSVRFLTKPFSAHELAEKISHLINGNGAHKE